MPPNEPVGDPLLERLALKLEVSFTGDADGVAQAYRVVQAAVQALRETGATPESICEAAIDAVIPALRQAERAIAAAEDRLQVEG
jgi:hypothetical protein